LPLPASPQINVGLPCGSPPPVISSRPVMPVGALLNDCFTNLCFVDTLILNVIFFKIKIIIYETSYVFMIKNNK
jgi:hypothetical protein